MLKDSIQAFHSMYAPVASMLNFLGVGNTLSAILVANVLFNVSPPQVNVRIPFITHVPTFYTYIVIYIIHIN